MRRKCDKCIKISPSSVDLTDFFRCGSLVTASISLQENRNVLAVPGPIDSELSAGCNELIAIGARPVMNANDILEELSNHFYTVQE
ncbi:DNA-processing protein DprA [Lactobacillus coleohominis]|nr:DNA-processing protein DprA [Limosilactobacillus coleohominis]